ncbi:EAL domain-containing protein [Eubacteriaceae bacterium ES2]|nr:EAL domain-containing protein [Eubacteriaceae bacterium ES2]
MFNGSDVLAIIFFLTSVLYIFLGMFVLYFNPKTFWNHLFVLLLFLATVWSMGAAFSIDSISAESSLMWHQVSKFAGSLFFIVLLDLTLQIIYNSRKIKINRFILYLPGMISFLYIVFQSPEINFTPSQWGFIDTNQVVFLNAGIKIYSMLYFLVVIALLWRHMLRQRDPAIKRKTAIVVVSMLIFLLVNLIIQVTLRLQFKVSMTQITPVLFFFPLVIISLLLGKLNPVKSNRKNLQEIIVGGLSRKSIANLISLSFFIGGIVNIFIFYFLYQQTSNDTIVIRTLLFMVAALLIQMVNRLKIEVQYKDVLISSIAGIVIPLIAISFSQYGAVSVWAFSFVLLLPLLIFREKLLLIIISVSTLFTQLIVWFLAPEVVVNINAGDYIARIMICMLFIIMAFLLNKLFVDRIDESKNKIRLQELIAQASTDCIGANSNNLNERISTLLCRIGEYFLIDHAYICTFEYKNNTYSTISEYFNESLDVKITKEQMQNIRIDHKHWRMEKILNNEVFVSSDLSLLPDFVNQELNDVELSDIKSQIIIPISAQEQVIGFWGMNTRNRTFDWTNDHIYFSKLLANILGDTLTRINSEKEINRMAYYDQVTGLPNRTLFEDYLYFDMIKLEMINSGLAVFFLDLDSFKTVNDTVGHTIGDELLKSVGEKLTSVLSKDDVVSRFSGDEFVMMVKGISDEADAIPVAKKLMQVFYEPFVLKGQSFYVTACTGIAIYPRDGKEPGTLIMNADIARFRAKELGRNQYYLCSNSIKNEAMKKNQIINLLYRSLEREELFLQYQPQVSLKDECIVGAEALLRWDNLEMGRISPEVLIPLAERTGLINPIGEWILKTACQQAKEWQNKGLPAIMMAVNISASQFKNPNFVEDVKTILIATQLDPKYLELEITESTAIQEFNDIVLKLKELEEIGVSISIDDFGSEYSSLGRLKNLPITRLKMDKQFIDEVGFSKKDQEIAKAIINLGKSLNLKIIAEGVEDESQKIFLEDTQCDEIQGFYYFRPLDAKILERILSGEKDPESW